MVSGLHYFKKFVDSHCGFNVYHFSQKAESGFLGVSSLWDLIFHAFPSKAVWSNLVHCTPNCHEQNLPHDQKAACSKKIGTRCWAS